MKRKHQIEAKKKKIINFGGRLLRIKKLNKQLIRKNGETELSFTVNPEDGEYVPKVNIDDLPGHNFGYR